MHEHRVEQEPPNLMNKLTLEMGEDTSGRAEVKDGSIYVLNSIGQLFVTVVNVWFI